MNSLLRSALVALGFCLAATGAARADTVLHVDGALVAKSGAGPAVILLPGLGGGPFVFAGVIPELAQHHTVYAVTLPGFDGVAPVDPPYLPAFEKCIVDLIAQEHLAKPLVVGHSLGGHLAVKLAEDGVPLRAVMAIDSVPLYPPARPGETPQSRAAFVAAFTAQLLGSPADVYAAQTKVTNGYLTTGDDNVALVTDHALRSDRTTEVKAAAEMILEDLGPKLGSITVPVAVLAAAADPSVAGATETQYGELYAGTPHLSVTAIAPSKHFIPLDAPARFRAALDAFVAANS